MRMSARERGSALILLLGITATLAILAATAVFVLANQQGATAADRTKDQAFNYAEAGLDSAVMAVRTTAWPAASAAFAPSTLTSAYDATYPSGSRPPLTIKVYDNQATVNEAITWDKGGPASATTPDGKLWVEAVVVYNGKTSRMRTLVGQINSTGSFSMPAAAIYTDANVAFTSGGGDAFGIKYPDPNSTTWVADTDKNAAIYAGGSFTGNWNTDLSPNGGARDAAGQDQWHRLQPQARRQSGRGRHRWGPSAQHGAATGDDRHADRASQGRHADEGQRERERRERRAHHPTAEDELPDLQRRD